MLFVWPIMHCTALHYYYYYYYVFYCPWNLFPSSHVGRLSWLLVDLLVTSFNICDLAVENVPPSHPLATDNVISVRRWLHSVETLIAFADILSDSDVLHIRPRDWRFAMPDVIVVITKMQSQMTQMVLSMNVCEIPLHCTERLLASYVIPG